MERPDLIAWRVHLRANERKSVDKLLFRIQEKLAIPMEVSNVDQNPEEPALYECSFTTALPSRAGATWVAEAVLDQAGRLALFWNIGAVRPGQDLWGESTGGLQISGVEDISFGLRQSEGEGL